MTGASEAEVIARAKALQVLGQKRRHSHRTLRRDNDPPL